MELRVFVASAMVGVLGCGRPGEVVRPAPAGPASGAHASAKIIQKEGPTTSSLGVCAQPLALEGLFNSRYREEVSAGFESLGAWAIPLRERLFSGLTVLGRRWRQDVEASCTHHSQSPDASEGARLLCLENVYVKASVVLELMRQQTLSHAQRFDTALDKLRLDISDCESKLVAEFFDTVDDDANSRTARALLAKAEIDSTMGEEAAPNEASEALFVAKQGSSKRLVVDSLLAVARYEKSALRHDVAWSLIDEAADIAEQAGYRLGVARAVELKRTSTEELLGVLRMKTQILGDSHREVAATLKNLSQHFRSVGNNDSERSIKYMKEALAIHRKIGGTSLVVESLYDLSSTTFDVRVPKDLPIYEEALALSQTHYGEDSPQAAHALKQLASYLEFRQVSG